MKEGNNLSIKIKKIREMKGLSQQRFGGKIGVSGKSISAYENGRCTPPVRVLECISRVYSAPILYIDDRDKENLNQIVSEIKEHILKIEEMLNSNISM